MEGDGKAREIAVLLSMGSSAVTDPADSDFCYRDMASGAAGT